MYGTSAASWIDSTTDDVTPHEEASSLALFPVCGSRGVTKRSRKKGRRGRRARRGGKRRRRRGDKRRKGGKRRKNGKSRKSGKSLKGGKRKYKFSGKKKLEIEYSVMIKRAIFRTQTCAGTNKPRVIKYLKKWYNINMFKVGRIVNRVLLTMVRQGLLFRNKKNPVMFRVTLKGARLRSKLEKRCRRSRRKRKGGKRGKQSRGERGLKGKNRRIC